MSGLAATFAGVIGASITSSSDCTSVSLTAASRLNTCPFPSGGRMARVANFPALSAVVVAISAPLLTTLISLPGAARPAITVTPSASRRTSSKLGFCGLGSLLCTIVSALAGVSGSGACTLGVSGATAVWGAGSAVCGTFVPGSNRKYPATTTITPTMTPPKT